MKGIIIYEDYRGKEVVEAIKLGMVNYECKSDTSDGSWINNLSGVRKESTQARCNKDDTYDFEIGALIALMKMCGAKKAAEACCEAFPHETSGSIYRENKRYIKRIKELEEKVDNLYAYNKNLINEIDQKNHEIISLKALKFTNESLKKDNESFRKTIAVKNRDIDHLLEENKMLCDKIKFLDKENRNLIYGGRQNGKQYTFLVDLFKKIPQNKVDEAYKEAYNTKLPVWQREFLKEALSIYKPPTKRERIWNDILACGDCEHSKYVEVKKEDLETFAKECNEKKIFNIIGYEFCPQGDWFYDDSCIFQIFRKPAGFICTKRVGFASEDAIVDYLPPMRWDLFKKGRLVVGCTEEEVPEFIEKAKRELGNIRIEKYSIENIHCNGPIKVYYHYDKDTNWLKPLLVSGIPRVKVNNHKVYYWEDVR